MRQAIEERHPDNPLLNRFKSSEARKEFAGLIAFDKSRHGIGTVVGNIGELDQLLLASGSSQCIDRPVTQESSKPHARRAAVRIEAYCVLPELEERIVDKIGSERRLAGYPQRDPVETGGLPLVEQPESRLVCQATTMDENIEVIALRRHLLVLWKVGGTLAIVLVSGEPPTPNGVA
ncbi:hypothetical protein NFI88_17155 [Acetobacteraceae bacterium KSS12]|uniref:Uncharacterized protein n=1 Tax=Rhizosaccharibacter radicis TaxID=2782605 RepID=A0ABT1W1R3_9PROT|nr:hypothetical protein [Acetobacteraceae bacterium KSS12]